MREKRRGRGLGETKKRSHAKVFDTIYQGNIQKQLTNTFIVISNRGALLVRQ